MDANSNLNEVLGVEVGNTLGELREEIERADLCAVFPFLPWYSLWLKIWFADEEFEASGKLLVSKSAVYIKRSGTDNG